MIISNFLEVEPKELEALHGGDRKLTLAEVFGSEQLNGICGGMQYIILPSGSSVGLHKLDSSSEIYIVLGGEGIAECDGERNDVCAGDTVICPAGSTHGIFNTSVFDLRVIVIQTA